MIKRIWSVLVIMLLLCLMGCKAEEVEVTESVDVEEENIKIGLCFDSFVIERWERDRDAFVAKCTDELGIEVNVQCANGDVETQCDQIDYLIGQKVDVIVVVAVESAGITDALKRAKSAGIKVIAYDRLVYDANVDLYITFDNEKVGQLMAKAVKEYAPEDAKILMISGPLEDNNVSMLNEGFLSIIKNTDMKIIGTEYATGWTAEYGFEYTSDYLDKNKDFDVVMCGNDDIASYVIQALSERRLAGEVIVVGQDADLGACQRIVEGTQTMTVYKPIEEMAQLAAEYAVMLANGEPLGATQTIDDGSHQVPYLGLEPTAVTIDNMEIIIEAGYHMEEDIYLNVE
ncbi:MAG: substrate-binding domain-containing protein [Eubacteriales bacterium]